MLIDMRNGLMAGGKLSARSYVQDGLVAMWDGIENAGWGVHDQNATMWKDLVGNVDILLYHTSVLDDGFAFRLDGANTGYGSASFPTNYGCIEVVLNKASIPAPARYAGCCIITIGSAYSGWGICDSFGRVSDTNDNASAPYVVIPYDQRCYIALNKAANSVLTEAIAKNGILSSDGTLAAGARYNNGQQSINTPNSETRSSNLDLCAIRLYSRALTAAEIAANYAVDKARFNLSGAT